MTNHERETSLRGSPLYMAPEILLQKSYDASVDLWSVGVILFECLFGRAPYSSKNLAELVDKIKNAAPIAVGFEKTRKQWKLVVFNGPVSFGFETRSPRTAGYQLNALTC